MKGFSTLVNVCKIFRFLLLLVFVGCYSNLFFKTFAEDVIVYDVNNIPDLSNINILPINTEEKSTLLKEQQQAPYLVEVSNGTNATVPTSNLDNQLNQITNNEILPYPQFPNINDGNQFYTRIGDAINAVTYFNQESTRDSINSINQQQLYNNQINAKNEVYNLNNPNIPLTNNNIIQNHPQQLRPDTKYIQDVNHNNLFTNRVHNNQIIPNPNLATKIENKMNQQNKINKPIIGNTISTYNHINQQITKPQHTNSGIFGITNSLFGGFKELNSLINQSSSRFTSIMNDINEYSTHNTNDPLVKLLDTITNVPVTTPRPTTQTVVTTTEKPTKSNDLSSETNQNLGEIKLPEEQMNRLFSSVLNIATNVIQGQNTIQPQIRKQSQQMGQQNSFANLPIIATNHNVPNHYVNNQQPNDRGLYSNNNMRGSYNKPYTNNNLTPMRRLQDSTLGPEIGHNNRMPYNYDSNSSPQYASNPPQMNHQIYGNNYAPQQPRPNGCYRINAKINGIPFVVLTETSVQMCQSQCQSVLSCAGFYIKPAQSMCYLFENISYLVEEQGSISGPQFCQNENENQNLSNDSMMSGLAAPNGYPQQMYGDQLQYAPAPPNYSNGLLGSQADIAGGLLPGLANAGNFLKTGQAVMEAGSTFMNVFPIEKLFTVAQQFYSSGLLKNMGINHIGGLGGSKQNSLPPPGAGKPTVTCAQQGMTCCVPEKTVDNKDKPPYLNGNSDNATCRAHFVSFQNSFCATTSYDGKNCGLVKTETTEYIIYQHTLTMPNMNDAVCVCRMTKEVNEEGIRPIEAYTTWEFSKDAITNQEEMKTKGENLIKKISSAVSVTNDLKNKSSQALKSIDSAIQSNQEPTLATSNIVDEIYNIMNTLTPVS